MKKIFAISIALILCFSCVVAASAKTITFVEDSANLITDSEDLYNLNNYAEMIEREYGYTIIFCAVDNVETSELTDYAKDAYYSYTDSENGYVFIHNVNTGYYSTFSVGQGEILDDYENELLEAYNTEQNEYAGRVEAFYGKAEEFVENNKIVEIPEEPETEPETEPTTESKKKTDKSLLVDNADLLKDGEEKELLKRLEAFTKEYEMEIAIVTVKEIEGNDIQKYGEAIYKSNDYGYGDDKSGVLLLYKDGKEGEREICIISNGDAEKDFFEAINSNIIDAIIGSLKSGDYVGAFNKFVDEAEKTVKPNVSPVLLLVFILFGVTGGMLTTTVIASKNKSVHAHDDANLYTRQGSLMVTGQYDSFVNTYTSKVAKAENSSNTSSSRGDTTRTSAKF